MSRTRTWGILVLATVVGVVLIGIAFSSRFDSTSNRNIEAIANERIKAGTIVGYQQTNKDVCYLYYGGSNTSLSCTSHP